MEGLVGHTASSPTLDASACNQDFVVEISILQGAESLDSLILSICDPGSI